MTWRAIGALTLGLAGGLLLAWLALIAALWRSRPGTRDARELLRLLPDVLRLLRRLAGDRTLPTPVRWRLWLLLCYLALPIDLVPDFLPVIGYSDDAVVVVLALRSVTRRAGATALERHWPGTAQGLAAVRTFAGLGEAGSGAPRLR